ncbi:MAG: hypothetical protein AMS26_01100 [Bacteroides sp. SM23_62]|nr:MAG: hypothetical protein AMS26_01100 [Bacteroides sp. SM23_62]
MLIRHMLFFSLLIIISGVLAQDTAVQSLLPQISDQNQDSIRQDSVISTTGEEGIKKSLNKRDWNITVSKIFWSIILISLALLSIRYTTKILETLGERWAYLRLLIKRLIPIYRITTWTIVIYIVIAWIIAPPIETLIAVTASAGIAVGFASQDILKNIFGGIMIIFDRPFQVGDKIEIGNHYGEVVQIGLRTVRIVTPDDSMVSIPNSELVSQSVSNSNAGQFTCQVVAELFLPADIDLIQLRKITYRAAAVSRFVYLKKPIAVIIKNEIHQGRSLLKVRLKAYVQDLRNEFAFSSEMTELVIKNLLHKGLVTPESLASVGAA